LRGEDLLLIADPWQVAVPAAQVSLQRQGDEVFASFPGCSQPRLTWSLELRMPGERLVDLLPLLPSEMVGEEGSERLYWHWLGKQGRGHRFVSERLPCPSASQQLRWRVADGTDRQPVLWLRGWRPGNAIDFGG
jgi:hypothetical protein